MEKSSIEEGRIVKKKGRKQVRIDKMMPFLTERSRLTINPGDITVNSIDHSTLVFTARHSPKNLIK